MDPLETVLPIRIFSDKHAAFQAYRRVSGAWSCWCSCGSHRLGDGWWPQGRGMDGWPFRLSLKPFMERIWLQTAPTLLSTDNNQCRVLSQRSFLTMCHHCKLLWLGFTRTPCQLPLLGTDSPISPTTSFLQLFAVGFSPPSFRYSHTLIHPSVHTPYLCSMGITWK